MRIERFRQYEIQNEAQGLADIEMPEPNELDFLNYKRAERMERLSQLDQGDKFHFATEYYFAAHNDPGLLVGLATKPEWIKEFTPGNYSATGIYAHHIYFTHLRALKIMQPNAAEVYIQKLSSVIDWKEEIESWRGYVNELGVDDRSHFYHLNIYTQALTGLAECLPEVYMKYIREEDWEFIRAGAPLSSYEGFNQGSGALRIFSPEQYVSLIISDTQLEETRQWLLNDEGIQRRYFEESLYYYGVQKLPQIELTPGQALPVLAEAHGQGLALPSRIKFDR